MNKTQIKYLSIGSGTALAVEHYITAGVVWNYPNLICHGLFGIILFVYGMWLL